VACPNVQQCYYVTGEWDFVLVLLVHDMDQYRQLTRDIFFPSCNIERFKTLVVIPLWWRQEGGRTATFGSDAHFPDKVGDGLPEATALLEHVGFQPGRRPEDVWTC
jgi:hypothetical protein